MIQTYDKVSKWNEKSDKIYTLWNFHIYSTMINTKHWYIGTTICIFNNKLQKISFKKSFVQKNEKGLKMNHNLFIKNLVGSFVCTYTQLILDELNTLVSNNGQIVVM
jgi:hypothetical protein